MKTDGTAWACGLNTYGQLGDGTTNARSTPVKVLTGVSAVFAVRFRSYFLKTDGSVWACGSNSYGELGNGTTVDQPGLVSILTGVSALAAGPSHCLFLKTDGSVWACGDNTYGQLGDERIPDQSTPVQVLEGVSAIAAGDDHSLFLMRDGSVRAYGGNFHGQRGGSSSYDPTVLTGVSAIAAGGNHSLFLKPNTSAWACGDNTYGQLGDGTTTQRRAPVQVPTGVTRIFADSQHSFFLKSDATLWASGRNDSGQLGDGTTIQRNTPVKTLSGVTAVSAGGHHTLFRKTDGSVWGAGSNSDGQLGNKANPPAFSHKLVFIAQTITFPPISDRALPDGNTLNLAATSSSGLPVSYKVVFGPATISGATVTLTGTGTVTIKATQIGNPDYAAASDVERSFTVTAGAPQEITFRALANRVAGAKFTLAATATSGLTVQFEIVEGDATLGTDGKTVTLGDKAGLTTIRATQPGGPAGGVTYAPATPVDQSFQVDFGPPTKPQIITFAQPPALSYGASPMELHATANSSLPVSFQLVSGPASLDGGVLAATGAGKVIVRAIQPGAYPYKPAAAVTRTITVHKKILLVGSPDFARLVTQTNPADFGLTYSGFVGTDTAAVLDKRPTASTKATPKSPAGVYPISITGGLDNNYAFVAGELGTLTVLGFGGSYETLLTDASGVPLGKLELTVSSNALTYTGTLHLASEPGSVTVVSNTKLPATLLAPLPDGSAASTTWTRAANPAKAIAALSLRIDLAGDTLGATLARGGLADLSGAGSRLFVQALDAKKKKLPAPWIGAHTLVLRDPQPLDPAPGPSLPASGATPLPLGAGHASAAVAATGVMSLKGKLADGVTLTATAKPNAAGLYRVFIKPYGKRLDSFVSGPLALQPHPDLTRFKNRHFVAETDGLLFWAKAPLPSSTKPAGRDKSYRDGFACDVVAILDPWIAPNAKTSTVNGVAIPAGTLVQRLGLGDSPSSTASVSVSLTLPEGIDFGARAAFLPGPSKPLALSAKGAFSVPAPLPIKADNPGFSFKVTPATGAFSGSFVLRDPAPTAAKPSATKDRKVTFSGTLRQGPGGLADILGFAHFLLDPSVTDASDEKISGELLLSAP